MTAAHRRKSEWWPSEWLPWVLRWMNVVRLYTILMIFPTASMIWIVPYIDRHREAGGGAISATYETQIGWASVWVWQAAWTLSALSLVLILVGRRPQRWVAVAVVVGGLPVYFWGAAFVVAWAQTTIEGDVFSPVSALASWSWWAMARLLLAVSYLGASTQETDRSRIEDAIEDAAAVISDRGRLANTRDRIANIRDRANVERDRTATRRDDAATDRDQVATERDRRSLEE